ncbi:hypothetical protein [Paracoccus aestuariivivens]|uniref:Uncharacterized protein n=1 Tax=Paracoccus aestuariivivens TaxID=1820333 RepID=A0A6L6JD28_9RHOB|nr:hypothetical protein [Paracoccus aestuariivivens]MTH80022.1 hypothetical protein [Paracoccus aestuariivivens]
MKSLALKLEVFNSRSTNEKTITVQDVVSARDEGYECGFRDAQSDYINMIGDEIKRLVDLSRKIDAERDVIYKDVEREFLQLLAVFIEALSGFVDGSGVFDRIVSEVSAARERKVGSLQIRCSSDVYATIGPDLMGRLSGVKILSSDKPLDCAAKVEFHEGRISFNTDGFKAACKGIISNSYGG